jgi:ketosteroid isomerase-like protein
VILKIHFLIMQKIYLLFIGMLLSAMVYAQHMTGEERAVQQAIEKMFAALTKADTTALKLFCTGDVKFYEYGQIWTMDTLIQKLMQTKSIPDFIRNNSFEFVSTTINKKTAWVTYYLQSTIYRNGKEEIIKWMETVILLKEKKQWRINILHSTRLVKN